MIDNLAYNLEDLFQEIVETGRAQGVATEEAYNELVEQVIEDKRSEGEMHDDNPTEGFEAQFREKWPAYKEALGLDEKNTQL